MLVFIQYCEVLRHVLLHVIMSILCFVEMTDLTSEHLLSCVGCSYSEKRNKIVFLEFRL